MGMEMIREDPRGGNLGMAQQGRGYRRSESDGSRWKCDPRSCNSSRRMSRELGFPVEKPPLTTVQFLVLLQVLLEVEGFPAGGLGAGEGFLVHVLVLLVVLPEGGEKKKPNPSAPKFQLQDTPPMLQEVLGPSRRSHSGTGGWRKFCHSLRSHTGGSHALLPS